MPGSIINHQLKLVVVDDEATQRVLLTRTLARDWVFEILVAENGAQAIEIANSEKGPLLFLLDWMMPDISGLEVCRHIKSNCPYASYVIFITGKKEDKDLVEALSIGGDDFVTKPFKREILQGKVRAGVRILDREEKLSEMVAQRENLIEALPDALVALSSEGEVLHWNGAACNLFRLKSGCDEGRMFSDVHSMWSWDRIDSALKECVATGARVEIAELEFCFGERNGYVEVHLSSVLDDNNTHSGFLVIARDISIRKQLEADLGKARRLEMIGQLASGVAHEINTPTQFVGDNLEFLQESFDELFEACEYSRGFANSLDPATKDKYSSELNSVLDDSEYQYLQKEVPKAIDRSIEGIKHVTEIVKAMNQFAHPGAKEKEPISLNDLVNTTAVVSKNSWKYVAELEFELDPNLPLVCATASEINQVILNLIVNSAHAIEAQKEKDESLQGRIKISTASQDSVVILVIEDNGCGMSKTTMQRIYDPFFTTKEVGKGTGQGLSITHAIIVDYHGGQISVESEIGKGSKFLITLPVQEVDQLSTNEIGDSV